MTLTVFAWLSGLIWLSVLLLPWQPWRTRERLEVTDEPSEVSLSEITVLIPARNEAAVIGQTLMYLEKQGPGLRTLVINDGSTDETAAIAERMGAEVIHAGELPAGWAGKLWALEQGRKIAKTPLILLLDADIGLRPGTLAALQHKLKREGLQLVSLMAQLRMSTAWERLLMPAFIFFFKLLYPFRLSNGPWRRFAAAAGGCILVEAQCLERIGGFGSLRHALIDDCTLAAHIKRIGCRTWIGLTHAAVSLRAYNRLDEIWNMIARSAFTQLRYSVILLLICTILMLIAFWVPMAGLAGTAQSRLPALLALGAMFTCYMPVLRYYHRNYAWCLALPLTATLFLAMTWSSAFRYWRGERSRWKDRVYQ